MDFHVFPVCYRYDAIGILACSKYALLEYMYNSSDYLSKYLSDNICICNATEYFSRPLPLFFKYENTITKGKQKGKKQEKNDKFIKLE